MHNSDNSDSGMSGLEIRPTEALDQLEAIYSLEIQKHRLLLERVQRRGRGQPAVGTIGIDPKGADLTIRPRRAA